MNYVGRFIGAAAVLSVLAAPCAALADAAPAAGVTQSEQPVNNPALVDMATRLAQLQQDVEQLRGQVQMNGHLIDQLKQRQRDLYVDIDRRLSQLERQSGVTAPTSGSADTTSTAPAAAAPSATAAAGTAAGATAAAAVAAPAAAATAVTDKERQAYQKAFDQLRDLHYAQAITAFRAFLKQYPNGRYSYIAQYWIAEADYAQRDFKQAIVDYGDLIQHYPKNPKVAEAMLKIGYCYYESGQKDAAKKELNQLLQRYPNSTEAGQASNFLQKMRQEGN